jgi:hypothetical protein
MIILKDIDFEPLAAAMSPTHDIIMPIFVAFCAVGLAIYFGAFALRRCHVVGLKDHGQHPITICPSGDSSPAALGEPSSALHNASKIRPTPAGVRKPGRVMASQAVMSHLPWSHLPWRHMPVVKGTISGLCHRHKNGVVGLLSLELKKACGLRAQAVMLARIGVLPSRKP